MNGPFPTPDSERDERDLAPDRAGDAAAPAPESESVSEAWLSRVISTVDRDLPEPDPVFLSQLRDRSLAAFLESHRTTAPAVAVVATQPTASVPPGAVPRGTGRPAEGVVPNASVPSFPSFTGPVVTATPGSHTVPSPPRGSMFSLPLKALSACVAGLALTIAAFFVPVTPPAAEASFGTILDQFAQAPGVEIRVERSGTDSLLSLDQRGWARIDSPDGSSLVFRDGSLFTLSTGNELAQVERSPMRSIPTTSDQALLELLGIDLARHTDSIRQQQPAEKFSQDGKSWYRYHFTLENDGETLTVDAKADAFTHRLASLSVQSQTVATQRDNAEVDRPLALLLGPNQRVMLEVAVGNVVVDPKKFEVSEKLADDGRLGHIADVQGLVSVKPAGQSRWTPIFGKLVIRPGDQVRSVLRGANAALVKLETGPEVTVGPGGLVEFTKPGEIRLFAGELATSVANGQFLSLIGPDNATHSLEGNKYFRGEDRKLTSLPKESKWLAGFKGAVVRESMGMLEANIDSRNVPLSVGYHRVRVDIRDQIARTEIEESFVNHTDQRLEGVFTFPLPADASISGFGMWIGNELVEADVVEKERAREIYETILAEKRDPGLLEWTGGNLFKARVFPIEAHSEKRIKISYTQVLPWRNNSYRYSYALQSDLLRQHPLRDLSLDLTFASSLAIQKVTSPSHAVRVEQTPHAAHVAFAASEYVPTRDFEVVVEADSRNSELVVIPHRRGEDGYFLMQFTPPAAGAWKREVLPDGKPLDLLIVADTSASMDPGQRRQQAEFVEALLGTLTPNDKFNLAACDVDCVWTFPAKQAATPQGIAAAQKLLADRPSLGWSDLAKACQSAFAQCGPETQVIYLGDGVVTAGSTDPQEFAQQLARLHDGVPGTMHAVAFGSSYERPVLQGMAALGGGTVRYVSQERPGRVIAVELLTDLVRPGLRNLAVEFRGIRTAAVYPNKLSNLPAGSQQVILGRFLPSAGEQRGEVVVTGELDGKPVRFSAPIVLAQEEEGNSFIPRLWARLRLDELLAQGQTPSVKEDVITLSEDFQIMTPYTSFLVLETDADRARFQVKRRFRIRDGERFFQEGRDDARFELVQQQMRGAGNWRLNLRQRVLQQFATLGRNAAGLRPAGGPYRNYSREGRGGDELFRSKPFGTFRDFSGPMGGAERVDALFLGDSDFSPDFGLESENFLGAKLSNRTVRVFDSSERSLFDESPPESGAVSVDGTEDSLRKMSVYTRQDADFDAKTENVRQSFDGYDRIDDARGSLRLKKAMRQEIGRGENDFESQSNWLSPLDLSTAAGDFDDLDFKRKKNWDSNGRGMMFQPMGAFGGGGGFGGGEFMGRMAYYPDPYPWLSQLIPTIPNFPVPPAPGSDDRSPNWTEEAAAVSKSLLRPDRLLKLPGGIEIVRTTESYEAARNRLQSRTKRWELYSPKTWLTRTENAGSQTSTHWCNENERGVVGAGFELGTSRNSIAGDLVPTQVLELTDYSLQSVMSADPGYTTTVEPSGDQRVRLKVVLDPANIADEFLIDTTRKVVLSHRSLLQSRRMRVEFSDFVETSAGFFPKRIETFDGADRRQSLVTQEVTEHDAATFARRMSAELAVRDGSQILNLPLPSVADAKRMQGQLGDLRFEDVFTLVLYYSTTQRWGRVDGALAKCERLAKNPRAVAWIREAVWQTSRRHEEWRLAFPEILARIQSRPETERLFLAQYLVGHAGSILEANESLELIASLQPIYDSAPDFSGAKVMLRQHRINLFQQVGRLDEAIALAFQTAQENPRDSYQQRHFAQMVFNAGDYEMAFTWLERLLTDPTGEWNAQERQSFLEAQSDFLHSQGRFPELVVQLKRVTDLQPQSMNPWLQFLGALVQTDREEEADALVRQWLKEASAVAPLANPVHYYRGQAAIYYCFGQRHYLSNNLCDEQWHEPLAEFVLAIASNKGNPDLADQVLGNHLFNQTPQSQRVRLQLFDTLATNVATLEIGWVGKYLEWSLTNTSNLPKERLLKIRDVLLARWKEECESAIRANRNDSQNLTWANSVLRVLNYADTEGVLPFLRRQLAEGPPPFRQSFAQSLYDHLLSLAWTPETENELFSLLDQTVAASPPAERLRQLIERLHSLTDAMIARREAIGLAAIENLGTLPRKQQADERQRIRREAQTGFAHRLQVELPRRPADLQLWINLEILHLDVQVEADLANCGERALALLDQLPIVKHEPQPEPDPARPAPTAAEEARAQADAQEAAQRRQLTRTARLRTLLILSHLACRPKADPKWADELLKFIAAAQTAEPANPLWKNLQYQVLVGLDRPLELKTRLAGWVLEEDGERWRLALGYLLAELGDVPAAIGLFEATETADELTPPAYRALSGWYQAAGRRAEYDHARIQIFKTAEEWQMGQMLGQRLQPWQATTGALPSKLNDDVLLLFRALFEKSGSPGSYLGYLQQFYAATHDFRLLSVLADSVIGHSAGKVYPFVQAMQPTLDEIRDEATADELRDQIIAVRKRAKTRVDQRALDLLELQVERRAAEVRNQPGPHIDRAVAALKRALAKTGWVVQEGTESVINLDPNQQPKIRDGWSPGEPRLMADFLASLGKITPQRLADVQIQALTELHGAQRVGSYDRLHIAEQYARVLWSQAAEPWQDKAIELLSAGLREFEQAQGGFLPYSARNAISTYSSYLRDRRRFIEAERFFDAQLKHPVHGQQEIFFTDRLYEVWLGALTTESPVSLGKGQELYQAMRSRLITRLETTGDQSQRYNVNSTLCSLYRVAADRKYATVQADLRGYATKIVPELLKTQTSNYTSIVVQVASTLHAVNGPREALAFLMDRTEQSPRWFRFTYNSDIWSNYGSYLAEWRRELGDVGDLSPRLEALFVAELRKDLTTLRGNYRIGYARDADSGRFWKEKTEVFAKVADEVYAKRGAQTEVVEHIARYLWSGLGLEDRAIAMLFDAHGKKVLGENGRSLLVQFLQGKQRFGESVALLEQLIEQNPDHVEYVVMLAYAYFQTQRPNDVARVQSAAEARFRSRKTWGEGSAARLGQSALQTTRYADAVRLLTEAIALREESRIDRGAQDGSLGTYYTDRALAYAGLGETAKAVDDATSGLVAWGPDARQHGTALSVLKQVLNSSPDLVKYAADLNRETAESKTDRPAVRKALGEVLLDKNQPAAAKEQLLIAWELRPYDAEVQRLLVTCLDRLEDPLGAIDRLLQSAQSSRRNYGVYADLGSRYDRLGDAAAAERARTSVLDLLPNDAEGHQNLAQIREGQNRFQDALTEWREVLRLRPMDPNGLFGVIRNQISAKDREGAKESLQVLKKTNWPPRYREPVQQQVRELEERISQ